MTSNPSATLNGPQAGAQPTASSASSNPRNSRDPNLL